MEETKEDRIEYKIYQIVCNETGEVYFGKTIQILQERLRCHKKDLCNSTCSSKKIIERGNYYIEEIDSTFNEEESKILERRYIETFKCVNEVIPGRTKKEYYEAHKEDVDVLTELYEWWKSIEDYSRDFEGGEDSQAKLELLIKHHQFLWT